MQIPWVTASLGRAKQEDEQLLVDKVAAKLEGEAPEQG
jgi:hypothetical protein